MAVPVHAARQVTTDGAGLLKRCFIEGSPQKGGRLPQPAPGQVHTLEIEAKQRSQPSMVTLLIVARELALDRMQNPPSLSELEQELEENIARTQEYEQSPIPLAQRMAGSIRRAIIPALEEEIAALKSGRRVLIVDTGILRDPVDS